MREPMVSIFWLNYNSSGFMDLALESLQGIVDIDFSNYELVVVDNGSTDGSLNVVKDFIEKKMGAINVKIIQLSKNLGFTGGNNVAYRARNRDSKYVVLLNNDAIPHPKSLSELVEFMESDDSLGAVQGIILSYDRRSIDSAGLCLSELLTIYSSHYHLSEALKKPYYITYAHGAYSVNRVSSIRKAVGRDDSIFDDYMFAHYDDNILGLKMWNASFKVATFPVIAARHKAFSSLAKNRPFQVYLEARGLATLNEISNSRYKNLIKPMLFNTAYAYSALQILGDIAGESIMPRMNRFSAALLKGFNDGVRIGRAKRRLGETVDLYKAPIVKVSLPKSFMIGLIPWLGLSGRAVVSLKDTILHGS